MILFVLPPLLSSVDIISTFNLNNFEHFNDLKTQYPDKSVRFEYFLATCLYMDADINLGFFFEKQTVWWFKWKRQFVDRQTLGTIQIS